MDATYSTGEEKKITSNIFFAKMYLYLHVTLFCCFQAVACMHAHRKKNSSELLDGAVIFIKIHQKHYFHLHCVSGHMCVCAILLQILPQQAAS